MDIRQLSVLLAVLETGGLAKASERLHISQPALTKIIQRLESELGVKLFTRQARGMLPTAYAEALRPYAQMASSSLAQAAREIEDLRAGVEGAVAVASSPAIGRRLLPEAIALLSEKRPRLRVRVALEPTESLCHVFSRGRFDFVIGVLEGNLPQNALKQRLLFYDKLVIVARRGHPLTRLKQVTPQDLERQRWVIADERSLNRRRLEHLFEAWGLGLPTAAIECRSSGITKEILMRSDCICLLARLTAHRELQSGSLETIEIDGANLDRPVCLLWPDEQVLSSGARALIEAILVVCRERGFMSPPRISVESGRPVESTLP